MLTGGVHGSKLGCLARQDIKGFKGELDSRLMGDCQQVENCVRGSSQGQINTDCILECFTGQDPARGNPVFHQLNDLLSRGKGDPSLQGGNR